MWETSGCIHMVSLFVQARKYWEVGLETIGDMPFFHSYKKKILDWKALLRILGQYNDLHLKVRMQVCIQWCYSDQLTNYSQMTF